MFDFVVVYKGRNWPVNQDGPNIALTVFRDGEYFQFYCVLFPPGAAFEIRAANAPSPAGVGNRWYQALTAAGLELVAMDAPSHEVGATERERVRARFLTADPDRVRHLESSGVLPEIRDDLFGGIEVARFTAP